MEKLITLVHESNEFVDRPVDKKISRTSFLDSVAGCLRKAVEISYALPQGRAGLGKNRGFAR